MLRDFSQVFSYSLDYKQFTRHFVLKLREIIGARQQLRQLIVQRPLVLQRQVLLLRRPERGDHGRALAARREACDPMVDLGERALERVGRCRQGYGNLTATEPTRRATLESNW